MKKEQTKSQKMYTNIYTHECLKNNRSRGITLIALVITIIILLILAGVAINALTGTGLFSKTQYAKRLSNYETAKEQVQIKLMEIQAGCYENNKDYSLKAIIEEVAKNEEDKIRLEHCYIGGNQTSKIVGDFEIADFENKEITAILISVKEYSEFKFLIGPEGKINKIVEGVIPETINDNRFKDVDEMLRKLSNESTQTSQSGTGSSGSGGQINIGTGGNSKYISSLSIQEKAYPGAIGLEMTPTGSDTSKIIAYFCYAIKKTDSNDIHVKVLTTNKGKITGLERGVEYKVVVKAYDINEASVASSVKDVTTLNVPDADIYVSSEATGNIEDGTVIYPYKTVQDAIDNAEDGDSIYIMAGYYEINSNDVGISSSKGVTVFGANEETVLYFDATNITSRDGGIVSSSSSDFVLRNLTFIYKPRSGDNYQRSMFYWTKGTMENLFIRVIGDNKASYCYDNYSSIVNIKNCTIFNDQGSVDDDYSGKPTYDNIATNAGPSAGNKNNISIDTFNSATSETSLETLIQNSKDSEIFNYAQAGVFYGTNAWE